MTVKHTMLLAWLAFAAMPVAVPADTSSASRPTTSTTLDFHDCTIGNAVATLSAECATVTVPLDYDNPSLGTVNLSVSRLRAHGNNPQQDPFTLIAGGPGQSAAESYPAVAFAFRHILRERDIILVDQRGTGDSNRLDCPAAPDTDSLEFDAELVSTQSRLCVESLDADPRFYTSSLAVRDLEQVRKLLGAEQWNLYGISYGTRVALHYMRRFPRRARTVILDAVVPPDVALGPDIAPLAQRALDKQLKRCANDLACNAAFPDIAQRTQTLVESLASQSRTIQFEDVSTGRLQTMEFTSRHLAVTLRFMSYSTHGASLLPSMLHEAIENENFAPLARQSLIQTASLDSALAAGMHNAVICTEDVPFINADMDRSGSEDTYLGADLIDALLLSCEQWPEGIRDDDFKQPVTVDVPTLVLSGDADPVTPPAYGQQVADALPQALHIINPYQGHMQAPLGCIPGIMAEFVDSADTENLAIDCLQRLQLPAFFIDANGPLP